MLPEEQFIAPGFRQQFTVFDTGCQGTEDNRKERQIDFWETFDYGASVQFFDHLW